MNINPYQKIVSTQTKVAVVYVGCDATVDFNIAATSADDTVVAIAERVTNLKCGSSFVFCGLSEPVATYSLDNKSASITVFAVFAVFRYHRDYKFRICDLSCEQLYTIMKVAIAELQSRKYPVSEETLNAFIESKKEKSN